MNNYLMIENAGELDINSLVLIGASTKRDDSTKLGFFGSGNKYALATLLGKGVNFHIFSGEEEVIVNTEDTEFRGVKFKKIIIDGHATSLTTDMGPQWEEWMAVREWVANSIDEGGHTIISDTPNVSGRAGFTRFYIEHVPAIKEVIDRWNNYFTFDREDTVYKSGDDKIYAQSDPHEMLNLYRKGIRCYVAKGTKSLYQYDISTFKINESRLIDDMWGAGKEVMRLLNETSDVKVLQNILRNAAKDGYWERDFSWRYGLYKMSATWLEAINNHCIICEDVAGNFMGIQNTKEHYIVSRDMAHRIRIDFPTVKVYGIVSEGESLYEPVESTKKMDYLLKECIRFLEETNYPILYPMEIVDFENTDVLGMAKNGKILLSKKIFDMGKREIVTVILEEQEHLVSEKRDCTRAFQNHWINLFLTEKEERFGIFL